MKAQRASKGEAESRDEKANLKAKQQLQKHQDSRASLNFATGLQVSGN